MLVDQTNATVTILGTPYGGDGITGVAADSVGRVFAVTSVTADDTSHLIEINPTTGALINDIGSMLDSSGNGCGVGDLSFQPGTDVLFGLAGNQSDVGTNRCGLPGGGTGGYLMTINTSTGQYTIIGRDATFGNDNGGIAFAPDGTLYFTPAWTSLGTIYTLNPADAGVLTSQALSGGEGYMGLAVRPSDGTIFGSYRYNPDDPNIYTIDPATGAETLVGSPGAILVHDLAFVGDQIAISAPVPTLSHWGRVAVVLMVATIAVFVIRRRLS